MDNLPSQTQPADSTASLKETLAAILTQEGLKQNIDIGLHLNDRNELPVQALLYSQSVAQSASDLPTLVTVNQAVFWSQLTILGFEDSGRRIGRRNQDDRDSQHPNAQKHSSCHRHQPAPVRRFQTPHQAMGRSRQCKTHLNLKTVEIFIGWLTV